MTLSYDSKTKTCWNIVLALVVFAFTPHLTYRLTFNVNSPDGWYWLLLAIYWIDVLSGFFFSARAKLKVFVTRKEIARHYVRRWFIADIIAAVPFEYFFPVASNGCIAGRLLTVMRLLFLLKLVKIPQLLSQVQDNLFLNPLLMRLIKFAFFFSHAVHYMALGWILIGASESFRPAFDQYLRSIYWCVTTVATIGYGDYYPDHNSNLQIFYTIIVQVFGVGMYGYIIGNMSLIIANLDSAKTAYMNKMEEINNFLRIKNVPRDQQKRVRDYFSYMWETRKNVSSAAILGELPRSCAMDILLFLNRDIIGKVGFFRNADDIFIKEIVRLLEPEVYLPGDFIISQGDYGDCMFFLSSGSVEVLVSGAVVATLHEGSPFGETALLLNEKRNASVRALSYCDVYKLSKTHFDTVRGHHPEFHLEIQKVTETRTKSDRKNEK